MSAAAVSGLDPGKQRRAGSGVPVVPAFDGYRAYAIGAIVLLHLIVFGGGIRAFHSDAALVGHLLNATLGQAIDVLFVISGFVVFLPTVARGGQFGSLGGYAIRRAARLVPAYYLILAIGLALIALIPVSPPLALPGVGTVVAHLLFLQTPAQMVDPIPTGFGVNGAVWTLSLEVTFYALLPLVASWYSRRPLLGLAAAAALTAAWHEGFTHAAGLNSALGLGVAQDTLVRLQVAASTQFPFYAFSFAAGMTGAWAYIRLTRPGAEALRQRLPVPALAVSLACLVVLSYFVGSSPGADFSPQAARQSPILAIGYSASLSAVMVAGALVPGWWQWLFANRLVRWFGDISYGVYLVHVVIVTFAVRALKVDVGTGVPGINIAGIVGDGSARYLLKLAVVVVPLSVLYGWASARFLEQPVRRWAQRYGRRRERARA